MIDANILINLDASGASVQVQVIAERPQPMRWSLVLESQSSGGVNSITQGGQTDGGNPNALASINLGPGSKGKAHLLVQDARGAVVAEQHREFDGTGSRSR